MSRVSESSQEKGSYGVDLWDCFHEVSSHLEEALDISKQIASYFAAMVSIEKEYSKLLSSLAKTELNATSKGIFKSKSQTKAKGSFMTAWIVLNQEIENRAKYHADFSNKINDGIVTHLNNFIKEKDKARKNLYHSGSRILKDHQEVLARKEKAEQKLDKHKKELEGLDGSKGNKSRIQILQEKVRNNEEELQHEKQATKESTLKTYQQELPRVLNDLEKIDHDRIQSLKQKFLEYCSYQESMIPFLVETSSSMKLAFHAVDPDNDIQSFIAERKRGSVVSLDDSEEEKPRVSRTRSRTIRRSIDSNIPTFEVFEGDDEVVRKQKLMQKLHEVRLSRRLEERTSSGIQQLMALYEAQPELRQRVAEHLESSEKKNSVLKDYEAKYGELLEKLGAIQDEMNSSDPTATSQNPIQDADDGENSDDLECVLIAIEPFPAEAIFDFVAVEEEELSFKAGMVLRIIAQGASGWWEAEINGAVGLVPSNYLKPLTSSS